MRRILFGILAVILLPPLHAVAQPQEGPELQRGPTAAASGVVAPFNGAFVTEVPIAVPQYRSITPPLKLAYGSSAGNGWMGVGWGVGGLSSIVRQSPGGGVPRYDANDVFYLDGMELIPNCTTQGGTHCTRIQNYTRIVDNLDGTWTVTGTSGNVATYEPLHETSRGTFQWAVMSVQDPNGNTVTY